jgi:hypothetical protein
VPFLTLIGRARRALAAVDYRQTALALAIGTGGGALLAWYKLPLAWMIGAMLFSAVASVSGAPVSIPNRLRTFMVTVLGVLLGTSFSPEILDHAGKWVITLSALPIYIATCAAVGYVFFRRFCHYDPVTSYFTATPGGLNEMVMIGGALGGDERAIALTHTIRIMLVVFTIPFYFQFVGVLSVGSRGPLGPSLQSIAPLDYLLFAACLIGAPIARKLRIPAHALIGPMILSGALHLSGITSSRLPGVLIATAQIVVGSYLGCRFRGIALKELWRIALVGGAGTVVLLGVTVTFSLILHAITGIRVPALILAYAPGGLAEMSLMAIALNVDAAFVGSHHVVRILVIVTFAPAAFMLLRRWGSRP